MAKFTEAFYKLVPSWLTELDGERVLYSLGLVKDFYVERVRQGFVQRMPSEAGQTALNYLAFDRGIPRGKSESNARYAARLKRWRQGHRTRGSAYALLEQLWNYWGGTVRAQSVDVKGNRFNRELDGSESTSSGNTWVWDSIPASPRWGRFWLVLTPSLAAGMGEHPEFDDPDLYGGDLGEPGYSYGIAGFTNEDGNWIRRLFTGALPWKPSGTMAQWAVVQLGADIVPDASYATWSTLVGITQTATRAASGRYVSLLPTGYQYAGNPESFCTYFPGASGALISGDPDSFPATITKSRGGTYAGNPDNFPATIRLPDDGDAP
jgi:hypothetical protein